MCWFTDLISCYEQYSCPFYLLESSYMLQNSLYSSTSVALLQLTIFYFFFFFFFSELSCSKVSSLKSFLHMGIGFPGQNLSPNLTHFFFFFFF